MLRDARCEALIVNSVGKRLGQTGLRRRFTRLVKRSDLAGRSQFSGAYNQDAAAFEGKKAVVR